MKRMFMALALVLFLAEPAMAAQYDLRFNEGLLNNQFGTIVREAGMLAAYRAVAPAEPAGLLGFDVGISASFVEIDSAIWNQAVRSQDAPSYLTFPRLQVRKGLPFNLDIGASYATVVDSDIELFGAEVQWAPLEGSAITPALAIRGSYSTLVGVDELDLKTYAIDAVVSKGLAMFTPYVGAGLVRIEGKYDGDNATLQQNLRKQTFDEVRFFGGLQTSLALLRLTLDVEYSRMPVYSAKISLGW